MISKSINILIPRLYGIDYYDSKGTIKSLKGTAFAISEERLITAAHVIENIDVENNLSVIRSGEPPTEASIEKINSRADLALLSTSTKLRDYGSISISETSPPLGSMCVWGGYARVIGEVNIRRARFAHGIVSSTPYGNKDATFFDLDGVFNPGHSGSAIIDCETQSLVGVVSKSAGDVLEFLDTARTYNNAVQLLSSHMDILWEVIESLNGTATALNDVVSELESRLNIALLYPPYGPSSEWKTKVYHPIPENVIEILIEHDLEVTKLSSTNLITGEPNEYYHLNGSTGNLFKAVIQILLKVVEFSETALSESFQMGIGIASCGKPLLKLAE